MTAQTNFLKVEQDLDKWFLGLKEENEILLAALAARLPILMEGGHGSGKSSIAKRIAKYFGKTAFYRQIKASMTIYDVFYEYDLALLMKGERKIIPKALGAEFVILDEALAHPILLSAIHDFIEDRSVDGVPASWRFCMFATNPKNEFYESSTLALVNFACYSDDTEILTISGWKKYTELNKNEEIFTLNPRTHNLETERIQGLYTYDYNGLLYNLQTNQIDQLVTPNHRMYVGRSKGTHLTWGFEKAEDLYHNRHGAKRYLKTANWAGLDSSQFTNDFLRIVGYYLADGSPKTDKDTGHYGISLSLCDAQLIAKARASLENLGHAVHNDNDGQGLVVWNKKLWAFFNPLGKSFEKYVPQELKEVSRAQLVVLLDSYFECDGWKIGKTTRLAKTSSPRLRDDMQEIALKCGNALNYSLYKTDRVGRKNYSPKLERTIECKHDAWTLHLITSRVQPNVERAIRDKPDCEKMVPYTGKVWCVSTINGILYVRRNGKPVWSGNTLDRFAVINYLSPPRTYDLFELGLRTEKQFKPPDPDFSVPIKVLDEAWAEVEKVKIPLEIHLRLQLLLSALSECSYTPSAGQTGKEAKEINKWMLMGSSVESLCGTCRYRSEICGKAVASPTRAQRAVIWLSKALAWLHGKENVGLEEFERALAHVMPHRIFYVPSFMREHPTAQNAFQSLYGMYQKDMLKRQSQGAFKLLTDIYKKLSAGAWDKASYDQLILNFADDLPLRKFVEGLKRKRYAEVKAALYEAVEKTSDVVQLGVMKGQITSKGLDFEDEVELGKLIDKKLAGDTATFTVKVASDTRGKVMGKITTVMARYADARELHTFLFDRATPSKQFATFAITRTEDGFTIVTLDKDTAETVRKKLPEAQEAQL